MLKNAKAKGARNERKAKKFLESHGYHVVKAGGSLGLFDLLAVGEQLMYMLQIKSNRNASLAERKRLEAFKAPAYAIKEIWVYTDRVSQPDVISVP